MDLARSLSSAQNPALTVIVGWDNPVCREA